MNESFIYQALKEITARQRYYYEHHKERWEIRYGKPYPEVEGEFGTMGNIRFYEVET